MFDIGVGEALPFVGILVGVGFMDEPLSGLCGPPRTRSQL